ncbi:MAG: histidine kinase [Bacteroidota bacterium]
MLRSNEMRSQMVLSFIISIVFLVLFMLNAYLFSTENFAERFLNRGLSVTLFGFIGVFVYLKVATTVINLLNRKQLERSDWRRWAIELLIVIVIAFSISNIIVFLSPPKPSTDAPVRPIAVMIFVNSLLGAVIFAIVELWNTFEENRDLQLSLANAEKEKVASQLLALQQRINPHFLFNSLSVLSELIYENPQKANDFIREFAKVYRYVLEFSEETLVSVKKELAFLDAYLFLQKIRFGESLQIDYQLDSEVLDQQIPPLSLQLLFENAIKHNQISKARPLLIKLANQNGHLVITNNLHLRTTVVDSGGVGLSNLKKTYQLISKDKPAFYKTNASFVAKLPLILNEDKA